MLILYIIIAITSFFIGSVPWAFIVVKLSSGFDISEKGSGNVGAMNSYEMTGKKWIGFIVFLLDTIKGVLAVLLAVLIIHDSFFAISLSAFFVVAGHNYSIFLKFRGGRGLATAVGASIIINPSMLIVWAVLWLVCFYSIKKDIHYGNIFATIFTAPVLLLIPENYILNLNIYQSTDKISIIYLSIAICFLIMIKHIQPLKEIISKK